MSPPFALGQAIREHGLAAVHRHRTSTQSGSAQVTRPQEGVAILEPLTVLKWTSIAANEERNRT